MSAAIDLTTKDNVKKYLSLSGDSEDAVIDRMITAISTAMQQWMDRTIKQATYTERRNGSGAVRLLFKENPVTAVASVVVNGQSIPASDGVSPGFMFDEVQLYLIGYAFTKGVQNVVINYTAGYATVPADLEQACIEWVSLRFRERSRIGQTASSIGGTETASFFIGDMPASCKTIMNEWRRVMAPC